MKKLMIVSIALFLVTATTVNAQSVPAPATPPTTMEKTPQDKTPIKLEELPDAVKTTIASDDYKGWTPKSASVVKGITEFYEVILVKGDETSIVKFDKDGKKLG